MNEIEKMYENANIKAKEYCDRDSDACMTCCPEWENRQDCWKYKSVMPPFTAEKQLELIKWLLDKGDLYLHRHKTDYTYSIAGSKVAVNNYTNLKESICEYVNALWEYLTSEEKLQIKEILNE